MTARTLLGYAVVSVIVTGALMVSAEAQYLYVGPGAVVQSRVYGPYVYGLHGYTGLGPYLRHPFPVPPTYVPAPGPYLYGPTIVPPLRNYLPRAVPPPGSYVYPAPPYRPQAYVRPYYPPRPIPPYYGSQSTHPRPRRKPATGEQVDRSTRADAPQTEDARKVQAARTREQTNRKAQDGRKQDADPNDKAID